MLIIFNIKEILRKLTKVIQITNITNKGEIMLKRLTFEEIKQFADREKVRKIAVENFLMTLPDSERVALANLEYDRRLYKWNVETVRAIRDGIKFAKV